MLHDLFSRIIPRKKSLKKALRHWARGTARNPNQILAALYDPLPLSNQGEILFYDSMDFGRDLTEGHVGDIPVPTVSLRMGYADSADEFVRCGQRTADMLRAIMRERGLVLQKGIAVLDWGCATGRVLQHFHQEATGCEFWGADIAGGAIAWAKDHFSPPFHFVTCTIYPHLPFEDRKFSFIYGCSVFTHIRHLTDCWLVELNRILRPGGTAVFTILDEHSVQWFREHHIDPQIMPPDFDLDSLMAHDEVFFSGDDWSRTFSFYKSDWIRRSWGRYFDVLDIKPEAEDYQTAVVLGKPSK